MNRSFMLGLALLWAAAGAASYRVKPGDTLSGIAARAGLSVAQVQAANPRLQGSALQAGWVLTLPERPVQGRRYTVQRGENLTVIATRAGVTLGALLKANPQYQGGKAVLAGATLTIPSAASAARSGTVTVRPAATGGPRPWLWPVPGYQGVSSGYGERDLHGDTEMHYGIDISAPHGTRVLASRSGRVLEARADFERGWGWTVVLEHPDGWITRYAHLSATLVRAGELVVQGQLVGRVGSTGRTTGPHLHFGTYLRWDPRDPLSLLR
ncbi:M23 family metallopeptidase [Deinococcus sp. HMF7604]|uniref:LysM peptidoglycan-binding domain-containing M23 family metallopeptidase n=1 Tax=Deinococcus betulae TaxID=2873312 RepID=UPI001CCB6FD1|nr:M23 family metallopeptidase [Deinococcus betulae]